MTSLFLKRVLCGATIAGFTLLSGCATGPANLYSWGSYQRQVYGHFNGKSSSEQMSALQEDQYKAASAGMPVPPGYHAHLGLLYGELGQFDQMQAEFEAEKQLFPESATFMDFLLKNKGKQGEFK